MKNIKNFDFFKKFSSSSRYDFSSIETTDPDIMKKEKKKLKNVVLSFLLNLGAGVLIANCFCHWLPEVREGLEGKNIDTFLPLAEVIMCAGFFFISALEEVLHHFLHPHQRQDTVKLQVNVRPETKQTEFSGDSYRARDPDYNDHHDYHDAEEEKEEREEERTAAQIKAAIRTVFVVFALSFHSVVEGLALSLEDDIPGIWLNTGATALHKFVISFSVGVELISNKLTLCTYSISIIVFSLAPALGALIGILLTELSFDSHFQQRIDLPLQILQGYIVVYHLHCICLQSNCLQCYFQEETF